MIGARVALGLVCTVFLAGCASAHYLPVKRADAIGPCQTAVPERDLLLGVALSGGGSRAALFGAAGLEGLAGVRLADGASVIEKISHLSSVSGGSLAATYYALKKPGRDVKVLNADGIVSDAYRAFFEQYRTDLSQDFETSLIWRQLLSFRWVNSALAARTLAEILAERLYGAARLQDISAREKAGDSPGLIVNTTVYNNGRRLAVTTLPAEAFDYDFFEDLERSLQQRGPITLKVGEEETYWHAGDGGLYENSGIESLLFLYLNQLQEKRTKRVLIIAFDSSYPFSVGERRLLRRSLPFSLLTPARGSLSRLKDRRCRGAPPHRRQVGGRHERSAAGLQGRVEAARDPRGGEGVSPRSRRAWSCHRSVTASSSSARRPSWSPSTAARSSSS